MNPTQISGLEQDKSAAAPCPPSKPTQALVIPLVLHRSSASQPPNCTTRCQFPPKPQRFGESSIFQRGIQKEPLASPKNTGTLHPLWVLSPQSAAVTCASAPFFSALSIALKHLLSTSLIIHRASQDREPNCRHNGEEDAPDRESADATPGKGEGPPPRAGGFNGGLRAEDFVTVVYGVTRGLTQQNSRPCPMSGSAPSPQILMTELLLCVGDSSLDSQGRN